MWKVQPSRRKIKIIHNLLTQNPFLLQFEVFIPNPQSPVLLLGFFSMHTLFGSCIYGHIIYPAFDADIS